jgi:NhaP-type Na+/H+ or K+/H+ antiporter
MANVLSVVGALAFGVVIGWITYRTLRRQGAATIGDIASVTGAVGGAAVTAAFQRETGAFGAYCIGLAVGFFGYLWYARRLAGSTKPKDIAVAKWLGETPISLDAHAGQATQGDPVHRPAPPAAGSG